MICFCDISQGWFGIVVGVVCRGGVACLAGGLVRGSYNEIVSMYNVGIAAAWGG